MLTPRALFYVRFRDSDPDYPWVRKLGRVKDSGTGTAKDAKSVWIELSAKPLYRTALALRLAAASCCPSVEIQEVVEIVRGEGKLLAKQLELFQ